MADGSDLITLTSAIIESYVSGNQLAAGEIPDLIRQVHSALANAGQPDAAAEPETAKATPAQIRKSVTPDHLISFEDGKPYKSLKRHLGTNGMTPDEYREKWGLPRDYPMVSPSYSAQRSELAKKLGLGNSNKRAAPAAVPEPAKRGRPPKAIKPSEDTFT